MMKNLLSSLVVFILFSLTAGAQLSNTYQFSYYNGTYTPITGGTAVTYLYNGAANADDGYGTVPIGFTFNYDGTNYTNIIVDANGFATFAASIPNNTDTWGNGLGAVTPPSGYTAVPRPIIAVLWDDMDNSPAGNTTYQLSGSAPNRVLTIQWANSYWEYSAATPVMSTQLKLYETTNVIEFVYRQESGTVSNAGDVGASIGISGTATTNFIALTSSSSSPSYSTTADPRNIVAKPATGQVYQWIPYCAAGANSTNTAGEKISRVRVGTIDNSSTSAAGYENFTSVSTILQPATTNAFTVNLSNGWQDDKVYIWIDFNHNGVFTDAGEQVYAAATTSVGPFTGNISIPALSSNVLLGPTRMRIRLEDTGSPPTNNTPCGNSEWGQVEDYTINIQNCTPLAITTQPANTFICNGGNGTISFAGTGTGLTYQWQMSTNGGTSWGNVPAAAPYSGTTTNTLTITGATPSMTGYLYRVIVNGTCSPLNTTSTAATLTVNSPGAITTNPVNTSGCAAGSVSFTAAASGSTPTYQWQVSTNGGTSYTDVAGATSATLTLTNLSTTLNGNRYRAIATVASCGSVTSTAGILTVNALPTVTLIAAPSTAIQPAVTTVLTAGSTPAAASYVWLFNGNTLLGATTSSITADVNGIGNYQVRVTDVNGCVNTSPTVTITGSSSDKLFVYPNPTNGKFQVRLYSAYLNDVRTIRIYNSGGVEVIKKDFNITGPYIQMDFDLTGAAPGVYTIRVTHKYVEREVVGQVVIL